MAADPYTCASCAYCSEHDPSLGRTYYCDILKQWLALAAECDIHSDRKPNPIQDAPTHLCRLMSLPYPAPVQEEAIA